MRKAMRFWDPPRGKCESCAECGDFPWKVRNADGTWDFLRGKYEMPCRTFDFLSRKDENPIRLCNLEFSRSKIALPYVSNRCAISGIRRRGGYILGKRQFSSQIPPIGRRGGFSPIGGQLLSQESRSLAGA